MFEKLSTFLFKLRPSVWGSGRFVFEAAHPWLLAAPALALALATAALYHRQRGRAGKGPVALLSALRVLGVVLLLFASLRPALRYVVSPTGRPWR